MRTRINNVNELKPDRQYVAVIGTTDCPLQRSPTNEQWWVSFPSDSTIRLRWLDGLGVEIYDVTPGPEPEGVLEWVDGSGNKIRLLSDGDVQWFNPDDGQWYETDEVALFEPAFTQEIVRLRDRVAELEGK